MPGVVVALTLPGVVVILIALAVIEQVASRTRRRGVMTRRHRPMLSCAGLDVFASALLPGKECALEQQRVERQLREDETDGGPSGTRVDLAGDAASIRLPPGS